MFALMAAKCKYVRSLDNLLFMFVNGMTSKIKSCRLDHKAVSIGLATSWQFQNFQLPLSSVERMWKIRRFPQCIAAWIGVRFDIEQANFCLSKGAKNLAKNAKSWRTVLKRQMLACSSKSSVLTCFMTIRWSRLANKFVAETNGSLC